MNFSELNLHPTVAGALVKRGYETATPVQAAVLHPDAAGRDLLVSSQTGSGKTIAFGAALAEILLAPDATRSGAQRVNPLALVIVPTRELAVQVREELGWLLRDTKLRLASFTGGTPVTGDLRTLQKGLDIAIGTPGRLVDLLKRQRLELSEIRVVVLDEADEMLDLGFREDLQTILQAAPPTRRTLLLSATLPPEIQALARRFQKDALRIDPRKDGDQSARGAHGDITYVAHLIAAADRLAVVVNILRAAGEGRAIVFCTTREGVSRLHAALLSRGFAATAISGDRAQAERDRALEQVRKGDARVLVATNVAARGLHLPDVDLIIHADLPLNAESLTHRSGRTGRAGRKGTAVVLASLTERRKAERLLMSANVPVVWSAPPSAETITAAARERLAEELLQEATGEDRPAEDPAAEEMVKRLEDVLPPRELARRLLLRELVRLPVGERVHHVPVPGNEPRNRFAPVGANSDSDRGGRRPGRQDFAREGAKFRVNIGAKDNADPKWLLPLICRRGGVSSRDVGAIRVGPHETVFEISGDVVKDFELSAAERDPRAPHVVIEPLRAPSERSQPHQAGGRPPAREESRRDNRAPVDARGPRPAAADRRGAPMATKGAPAVEQPRYSGESNGARKEPAAPAPVIAAAVPPTRTVGATLPAPPASPGSDTGSPSPSPSPSPSVGTAVSPLAVQAKGPARAKTVSPASPLAEKTSKGSVKKHDLAHADTQSQSGVAAAAPSAADPRALARAATAAALPPARTTGPGAAQPASIFQTRGTGVAPFSAPGKQPPAPSERPVRAATSPEPVVEMKRAPRIQSNGNHPRATAPVGASAAAEGSRATDGPRSDSSRKTDGSNPPKRTFPSAPADARAPAVGAGRPPSAFASSDGARKFDRPQRPSTNRRDDGEGAGGGGGRGERGDTRERGGEKFPPRRASGPTRGPAGSPRHSSAPSRPAALQGRPSSAGSVRPGTARAGAPRPPSGPAPGSPRPPFWKEGARKRPVGGGPARPHDSDGSKGKPPHR